MLSELTELDELSKLQSSGLRDTVTRNQGAVEWWGASALYIQPSKFLQGHALAARILHGPALSGSPVGCLYSG